MRQVSSCKILPDIKILKTSAVRSRISSQFIFASCVEYFDRAYDVFDVTSSRMLVLIERAKSDNCGYIYNCRSAASGRVHVLHHPVCVSLQASLQDTAAAPVLPPASSSSSTESEIESRVPAAGGLPGLPTACSCCTKTYAQFCRSKAIVFSQLICL